MPSDPRTALLSELAALQASFAAAVADVAVREAVLVSALDHVRVVLAGGIQESALAPAHPLSGVVANFNDELKTIVADWITRVERHQRNVAFRQRYADSLVVFVLGKVKAGKSSLGNYMAYGRSDPAAVAETSLSPHFFTAAVAGAGEGGSEAASGQGGFFRVGASETTKTIQGFRLPGLTWIDSPGLHSVTEENGALASDYVDVADLIIYPMHTGAPGRTGDIAEIRTLLAAKKRLLVIITQCDRVEEDVEPNGAIVQSWVMKEPGARQGQMDYVRNAISAGGEKVPIDLLSLSVRYAEIHGNDASALEASGVAGLYRLLTKIAQSEGISRKREMPSLNLDRFVDLVLGTRGNDNRLSLPYVLEKLDEIRARVTAAEAHLEDRARVVTAKILEQIRPAVDAAIKAHAADQDQRGFEEACSKALLEIVGRETEKEVMALMAASGTPVPTAEVPSIAPMLKLERIVIKVPRSNRARNGALGGAVGGAGGMFAGAAAGAIAGSALPIVGTAIGGFLGGLLGSLAGGAAGTAAGQALGSDWEQSMTSGEDNRAAVAASAVEALQAAGSAAVTDFFASIKAQAISPVEKRANTLRCALDYFSSRLQNEVHSNG